MELKILEKKIEEIKEFIKNGFYDKALNRLNEVMDDKNNAENVAVMLEMGQVFLAKKDFDKARTWFEKVLNIDKHNIYATEAILRLLYNIGDYNGISVYLKKIFLEKERFSAILEQFIKFLFENLNKCSKAGDKDNIGKIIDVLNLCEDSINNDNLKNILVNESEIFNKKIILNSKPRNLIISITSRCNIKCKMCKIPLNHWDFPKDKIHEIYNLLPTLQKIIWHGGEPFLYQHIDDLIAKAGEYNIEQIVSTNGLLLNEERIKKIIGSKMELNISIHGFTKEVYESIHCGASFKKLLDNLGVIKNIKEQSKSYMKYGLKFLVMKTNHEQLKNLYDFAVKYGFNHVYVNTLGYDTINEENFIYHYRDDGIIKNVIENSEILASEFQKANIFYEAWLPDICENKNEIQSFNQTENKTSGHKKFCCYMPWQTLQIDAGGFVRNNCYCENLVIGNINEHRISDIWNNEKIKEIRKNIVNEGFDERCSPDCKSGRISELYLKNRF